MSDAAAGFLAPDADDEKSLAKFVNWFSGHAWGLICLRIDKTAADLEQSAFHLIPIDCPTGVGLFGSTVEFEIWRWADLFDEFAKQKWLATVNCASRLMPASDRMVFECEAAANPKQQVLMRDSPVVSHSELWFDPDETRLVLKAPGVNDVESFTQEGVGCP